MPQSDHTATFNPLQSVERANVITEVKKNGVIMPHRRVSSERQKKINIK